MAPISNSALKERLPNNWLNPTANISQVAAKIECPDGKE